MMMQVGAVREWLAGSLRDLVIEHGVPGASVAVLVDGEVVEAAAGVLNVATGEVATTGSMFRIGSITKVWTATLVLQLADEGVIDLDTPIRAYLPGFRVADGDASRLITTRQLLCHTAGFGGDVFTPTSDSDDAVQRFVDEVVPNTPQYFTPGDMFSYNNCGYTVLGRLVEVARNVRYPTALRKYLVEPLGMEHVAVRPDESNRSATASGHGRSEPEAPLKPVTRPPDPAGAPAGSTVAMSARALITFARMHLDGGRALDGTVILSERSVRAMQTPHVTHPPLEPRPCRHGLGWFLQDWPGGTILEHRGIIRGQLAYLYVAREARVAIALLTNGGNANRLSRAVCGHLLRALADIDMPPELTPPAKPNPVTDPSRYVGRFTAVSHDYQVSTDAGGGLQLARIAQSERTAKSQPRELIGIDADTFASFQPTGEPDQTFTFVGDDVKGRAQFLHNSRAIPRVD